MSERRSSPETFRCAISYGEQITWCPPDGTASYRAWTRAEATTTSRWIEAGGFDIERDVAIDAPDGNLADLVLSALVATLPWAAVNLLAGEGIREALQIISYDTDVRAIRTDRYQVPVEMASDLDTIIATETEFLGQLLLAREDATNTNGIAMLELPDGRKESYRNLETLDVRVQEIRARLAWFEAAAAGNVLPRSEFW